MIAKVMTKMTTRPHGRRYKDGYAVPVKELEYWCWPAGHALQVLPLLSSRIARNTYVGIITVHEAPVASLPPVHVHVFVFESLQIILCSAENLLMKMSCLNVSLLVENHT